MPIPRNIFSHVHLVAHPKKTEGKLQKESVSGIADITNRADNVFSVERPTKQEDMTKFNTALTILKNRSDGVQDVTVGLWFDNKSKRFYQSNSPHGANKRYSWEDIYNDVPIPGMN